MTDRVSVVPYDPDWPRRFDDERRVLAAVFAGSEAVIEHVGSTAVPGLGAKPVIDIMVGVQALLDVDGRIPLLEAAGYEYVQEYEKQRPNRRYFRKPPLHRGQEPPPGSSFRNAAATPPQIPPKWRSASAFLVRPSETGS